MRPSGVKYHYLIYSPRSRIISSRFRRSKSISRICGATLSRIAPSWINRCVLVLRSFLRFLASASSCRCFACKSAFSSDVIVFFICHIWRLLFYARIRAFWSYNLLNWYFFEWLVAVMLSPMSGKGDCSITA